MLTEVEALKLKLAQTKVSDASRAYAFSYPPNRDGEFSALLIAAHEFANTLKDIGMEDYWIAMLRFDGDENT